MPIIKKYIYLMLIFCFVGNTGDKCQEKKNCINIYVQKGKMKCTLTQGDKNWPFPLFCIFKHVLSILSTTYFLRNTGAMTFRNEIHKQIFFLSILKVNMFVFFLSFTSSHFCWFFLIIYIHEHNKFNRFFWLWLFSYKWCMK